MSDHISIEELADAAEGLLEPARANVVGTHVALCAACQDTANLLAGVTSVLANEPVPSMPPPVVARLQAVIAAEQARRLAASAPDGAAGDTPTAAERTPAGTDPQPTDASATVLAWPPRPRLASSPSPEPHRRRAAGWILAAAAAAALVGFGGYVVSARAGLNEPPAGLAAVSSGELRVQAGELEQAEDIEPHRFSQAWSCARQVTDGRITGIASVTVDGAPALLVYLSSADGQRVSVVKGCDDDAPRVTATTRLPR